MIWVPFYSVNGQVVILVSLKILSRVRLGAKMNLTLFCADQEQILHILVKVEAHAASKTVDEWLLLAISELLLLVNDELQLDDFLRLQLILHQVPECDATIRRNRVEAEILALFIVLPTDLPNWICVLVRPHCRLVDRSIGRFLADIEDHDGTIIASSSDQSRARRMEVNAHHT